MQKSSKAELFLDTTVIVSAITKRNTASYNLLLDYRGKLYTNEYAMKETRRILKNEFRYSDELVNKAIDYIRVRCDVLPTPHKKEFGRIILRDKADNPIVCSAMKKWCVLVIDDEETYQDAKEYVETRHSEEIKI